MKREDFKKAEEIIERLGALEHALVCAEAGAIYATTAFNHLDHDAQLRVAAAIKAELETEQQRLTEELEKL